MWAQNSLWACMGIFLVSGLIRLGPENLYLNTHVNVWSLVIATQNGSSTDYIFPFRLRVLQ